MADGQELDAVNAIGVCRGRGVDAGVEVVGHDMRDRDHRSARIGHDPVMEPVTVCARSAGAEAPDTSAHKKSIRNSFDFIQGLAKKGLVQR